MSNDPIPAWQRDRLALLLGALGDVPAPGSGRTSLLWLAGSGLDIVHNVAAVISRVREIR
ncbi:MAG: hypothetical protein ACRDRQ_21060 [Pseudonocardiaceae bacterium]